jgi:flagellar motility protein MotE (MotC chaperone)
VALEYSTLASLQKNHPAWRLLRADHAPLIASFLQQHFIEPNRRLISQSELVSLLEDHLFTLRETLGEEAFPRRAQHYLDEWAENEKGWLRKFYPVDSDEPHFDLTPATERAINWLESLNQRSFVGTESRLMTIFDLLRQMVEGSESDPATRIAELRRRREQIDQQIEQIEQGSVALLDETGLRDRFQQFNQTARELLSDFREVEQNFRLLDQQIRERITLWEGNKGALLEQIFGERDLIADSDQGKSFRAFWDFLMSPLRQEELDGLLEQILALPPIREQHPDRRLRRIHYDWLEAGEQTQRTVARLSQQLRRYLDDQSWLESRRIMNLLHQIESHALQLRETPPKTLLMEIDAAAPTLQLPMERPLYTLPLKPRLDDTILSGEEEALDASALFEQRHIDLERLRARLQQALQLQSQVTLKVLLEEYPLQQGLAELIGWLSIAGSDSKHLFDESELEQLEWQDESGVVRRVEIPRVIYNR